MKKVSKPKKPTVEEYEKLELTLGERTKEFEALSKVNKVLQNEISNLKSVNAKLKLRRRHD